MPSSRPCATPAAEIARKETASVTTPPVSLFVTTSTVPWVERTASRWHPLALIFLPFRRSTVSSTKTISG